MKVKSFILALVLMLACFYAAHSKQPGGPVSPGKGNAKAPLRPPTTSGGITGDLTTDVSRHPYGNFWKLEDGSYYMTILNYRYKFPSEDVFKKYLIDRVVDFTKPEWTEENKGHFRKFFDKHEGRDWPPPYISTASPSPLPLSLPVLQGGVPFKDNLPTHVLMHEEPWYRALKNNPNIWISGAALAPRGQRKCTGGPCEVKMMFETASTNNPDQMKILTIEEGHLRVYDFVPPPCNKFVKVWENNTSNAYFAVMGPDGDFLLYDGYFNIIWSSGTSGNLGAYLKWGSSSVDIYSYDGRFLKSLIPFFKEANCQNKVDEGKPSGTNSGNGGNNPECQLFTCAEEFNYVNGTSHLQKVWKYSKGKWTDLGIVEPEKKLKIKLEKDEQFSIRTIDITEVRHHNINYPHLYIDESSFNIENYISFEGTSYLQSDNNQSYDIQDW